MPTEAASVLSGVITPVVTAITPGGSIDRASQEAVCAHQLEAGADGIFVAGTTGEGAILDSTLLGELVDVTVRFVAGQAPVLVGALAPGTAGVIERARIAETKKADGVVVTTPFYGAVTPDETYHHFAAISAASSLPVLAYSIPPMTHQELPASVIERLFAEGLVVGVKDSGHDWDVLAAAIDLGKKYGKAVFSGYEPFAARAVARGASGIVASIANLDPKGVVSLWRAAGSAEPSVDATLARLLTQIDILGRSATTGLGATSALIGGIKAALQAANVMATRDVLLPLTTFSDAAARTLVDGLKAAGFGNA